MEDLIRLELALVDTLKTGNPILVRNNWEWKIPFSSLLYALVRWLTGCYYNHIVMAWNTGKGIVIVESNGKGVVATELALWLKRRKRTIQVLPLECDAKEFIKHLGKRYDCISFLFYSLHYMIFNRWIGKTGEDAQEMFTCSELVATAHQLPEPYTWMPKTFLKFIKISA